MTFRLPSFTFAHPKLDRVRDDILQRYPAGEAARPRNELPSLESLLRLIRSTPVSKIGSLARRLSPADIETLVYNCPVIPDDLDRKVQAVVAIRWRRRFAPTLWNHFLQSPLRRVPARMAALAAARGAELLPVQVDAQPVIVALESDQWLHSLSRLATPDRRSLPENCKRLGLDLESPAAYLVSAKILCNMAGTQIQQESSAFLTTILRENHRMSRDAFVAAVGHYLISVPVSRFHADVLEFLRAELGRPERSRILWSGISEEAQAKFNQWLAQQLLHEILAGDHERLVFWRSFADYLRQAFDVKAGSTKALVMVFSTFVAVEFLAVGNACYLYTRAEYERLLKDWVEVYGECPSEGFLKQPVFGSLQGNTQNNRIIHRADWQSACYPIVRRLVTGGEQQR